MTIDDKLLLVGKVLKVKNNSKLILKHDWIVYHLIEKNRMIMSYGVKSMIIKCAIKIDKRGVI